MKSIPKSVYPVSIDSDYTLFKTFNSTQSILAEDVTVEATEIAIVPKIANEADVWANNGFVTIEDEIIYYDTVTRNENGKVNKLCDCIRGLEGRPGTYIAGTPISSNVVAQTHNQLVDAILSIEDALGDLSDLMKVGTEIMNPMAPKKSFAPAAPALAADVDMAFTASLHASLTNMLGCAPVGDDACPDVEFIANNLGDRIEFCLRIFGNFNPSGGDSFEIDFGDGTTTTQMSGVWGSGGAGAPKVTVHTANCCIIQEATTPNEACEAPQLDDPSVPFVVHIPEVPVFPQFIAPKQICPGPLFNLPPIIFPEVNFCGSVTPTQTPMNCPSVIVSVIEACKTPQIIRVVSPCRISIISLVGCELPSIISLVGCCPPSIISLVCPDIPCISFCEPPSFACVSFCAVPSFDCISFCQPPVIPPISFAPFPSIGMISFDVLVDLSVAPICFCPPPSFQCISFCEPPSFSLVRFETPPSFQCISFCNVPSFTCISFCDPPSFQRVSFDMPSGFPLVSFAPFPSVGVISFDLLVDLSVAPICFCPTPSFQCISFCDPPSFETIRFDAPPDIPPISFAPFPSIGAISFDVLVDLSIAPICFCPPPSFELVEFGDVPSFDCISFCETPSFQPISFGQVPFIPAISFAPFPSVGMVSFDVLVDLSVAPICFCPPPVFDCISFCDVPSFGRISFDPFPVVPPISFNPFPSMAAVSFDVLVDLSVAPICFCPPPSFESIKFDDPPVLSVIWGIPPTVSCIVTVACPSTSTPVEPMPFAFGEGFGTQDFAGEFRDEPTVPVTINDLGIPEEIRVVVPKFPDIRLAHNLPKEIGVTGIPEEIRLVGPEYIEIRSDIPRSIEVKSDIPTSIKIEGMPARIVVEPAANFPSVLTVVGMPQILQVTGIPNTIKLEMPDDPVIKLVMPDDPVVEMRYSGPPLQLGLGPDLEKLLSNLIVQPK